MGGFCRRWCGSRSHLLLHILASTPTSKLHTTIKRTHSLPVFGGIANILPPASPAPSPPSASTPAILVSGQKQCTATQCLDFSSTVWPCRTVQCPVLYSTVPRAVQCSVPCCAMSGSVQTTLLQSALHPCIAPKMLLLLHWTFNRELLSKAVLCLLHHPGLHTIMFCRFEENFFSSHFVNLCNSLCFFFTFPMLFRGAATLEPFLRIERLRLDGGEREV